MYSLWHSVFLVNGLISSPRYSLVLVQEYMIHACQRVLLLVDPFSVVDWWERDAILDE
jgi:hypothetical protein